MTSETHIFSRKQLWQLIWPLVLEQFLAITLGISDIIMVASLGESAVSGVSLVDTVFVLINSVFAALATGGAVVCSQYIGQKKPEMASKTAKQLIYTVIAGALVVMVVGFVGGRNLLSIIFGNIDADVMANSQVYFHYTLLSLPSVALYNGCAALFRAQGNSKVSMFTALFMNVVNITGCAVFIFVLHSGVEGPAISTFVARTMAALILFALLLGVKRAKVKAEDSATASAQPKSRYAICIRGISKVSLDTNLIGKILQIGVPNGLENGMFQLGKILVLTLVSSFGTGAIAANAASNTISSFEVLPPSAIGLALLTVVGQCMGAGRSDEAVYYTKKLMLLAYISMAVLNIPLLLGSKWVIGMYGMSAETTHLAWMMFMCHGLCGMLFWPASFTLPSALRASNDAKYTMIVSLSSMWAVRIGLSYVFALPFGLGLGAFGVWVAMACDWIVRDVFFIGRFARGKWRTKRLV